MLVIWDEPKRAANLHKHGIDFADFEGGFEWERARYAAASNSMAGRFRFQMIGLLNGTVVAAVVSPLGSEAVSIVSARRANRKERSLYAERS